jgi:hypothetical protein
MATGATITATSEVAPSPLADGWTVGQQRRSVKERSSDRLGDRALSRARSERSK